MFMRADKRPTRRAVLFAYLCPLFGSLLPRRCPSGASFTSIEGSDLAWLLRWCCGFTAGPRLAAAA